MAAGLLWAALLQIVSSGIHPFDTQVSTNQLTKESAQLLIKTALVNGREFPGLQDGSARLQCTS